MASPELTRCTEVEFYEQCFNVFDHGVPLLHSGQKAPEE